MLSYSYLDALDVRECSRTFMVIKNECFRSFATRTLYGVSRNSEPLKKRNFEEKIFTHSNTNLYIPVTKIQFFLLRSYFAATFLMMEDSGH